MVSIQILGEKHQVNSHSQSIYTFFMTFYNTFIEMNQRTPKHSVTLHRFVQKSAELCDSKCRQRDVA